MNNAIDLDLGGMAKQMRLKAGMKQGVAAAHLGVTQPHLCNVEQGKQRPSIRLCRKFEQVFGQDLYVAAYRVYRKQRRQDAAK